MEYFVKILFFLFHIIIIRFKFSDASKNEVLVFETLLKTENAFVALFTEECCTCTDCVEAEVLLSGMSKELQDNLGITVVRFENQDLRPHFGIKKTPTLVYIRNYKTAMYDGKFELDELYMWLQENQKPATLDLDDSNFEHLTQAATGATTGDWLVLFHDGFCCKNRELMKLENAGIKLKNKVNVAVVDTRVSPETTARFKLTTCPEVILFRHQKLYRFSLSDVTTKTLWSFAEGFYKNSKAERVPLPPTQFDKLTDKTLEFIIENISSVLVVLLMITIPTILLLIYAGFKQTSHTKKD